MRTNIDIDDELMARARELGGFGTKKATVEEGLKLLIAMKRQESIRALRGAMHWEGDLDAMRRDV